MATIDFESLYLRARTLEKRIYSDEVVAQLPVVAKDHPHKKEWSIRQLSLDRLSDHIKKTSAPLSILEIGCGNGWLSNKLAVLVNAKVCGIDLNKKEIEQAKIVFRQNPNVNFIYGNFRSDLDPLARYDIIILAATIQYLKDPASLLSELLQLLNKNGEIHIMDSPFYSNKELPIAKKRTKAYYEALGVPELSPFYHHHSLAGLSHFSLKFLYRPIRFKTLVKKCFGMIESPFPWIMIKTMK